MAQRRIKSKKCQHFLCGLICHLVSILSYTQTHEPIYLKMNEVIADSSIVSLVHVLTPVKDTANIKNIPKKHHFSSLRFIILNDPDWLKRHNEGCYSNDGWFEYDDSLTLTKLKKGRIFPVFTTLDTITNTKYFIIDANSNLDFSDDSLRSQNMGNLSSSFPFNDTLHARFQYLDSGIKEFFIPIKIYPYQTISFKDDSISPKLGISISYNKGLKGDYSFGGDYSYIFSSNIPNFGLFLENTKKIRLTVETINKDYERIDYNWYYIGDTVNIVNNLYLIDKIDWKKKELILKFLKSSVYGYNVGNILSQLSTTDFISKERIIPKIKANKYLLLDFWGTWCAPCVKTIPQLKKMIQNAGAKLQTISIAYDSAKDTGLLRKMIFEKKMNWSHVWLDRTSANQSNLVTQFRVDAFPTYILVNTEGKIIYRGTGENTINAIRELLK